MRIRANFAPEGGGGDGGKGAGGQGSGGQGSGGQGNGADWIAGITNADVKTMVQTKGYKSIDDLGVAYINSEKAIGADKIALPGKDAKPEDWNPVFERLGWPKDPKGYEFKPPAADKLPQGFKYDESLAAAFRTMAHKRQLTAAQAAGVHDDFVAMMADVHTKTAGDIQVRNFEGRQALEKEFGAATATKFEAANRALKFFGGDELVKVLEKAGLQSDPAMVKAWAKIGEALGEKGAAGMGGGAGGGFSKTPDEAKAEIAKIRGEAASKPDHPLNDKHNPEHATMVERLKSLYAMAHPEQGGTTA